jgi:hypothetical protein
MYEHAFFPCRGRNIWIISTLCPRVTEGDKIYCILIVVDRLSKDRIYEPLASKSVNDLADAMHRRVFYVKGLSK